MKKHLPRLFIVGLILIMLGPFSVQAQAVGSRRPIDMMILIDNSCSMFPANQILAGCDAYGSDPDFLRIVGADLFIARLGFTEPNEADYRLGVISIGKDPQVISDLQSVSSIRYTLASKIARPVPQVATQIIPALESAYTQLEQAKAENADHTRAIVMVTDGVPWPREEQPNSSIESLITKHADTPLFVMLLKNPERTSVDYESYITFWQGLQVKYPNINVYLIEQASQIEETYNQILGQLQSTIPTRRLSLKRNTPTNIQVSAFSQRLILTVIRGQYQPEGQVTIKDPLGKPINADEDGVNYFHTRDNPVEVYSITAPRLADELKGKDWVISSTGDVRLMVDQVGAYQINITSPTVESAEITNQFIATERQPSSRELLLKFQLTDSNGSLVTVPQPVDLSVTAPDGTTTKQVFRQSLNADNTGSYQLRVDLQNLFLGTTIPSGRYTFSLTAGELEPGNPDTPPISNVRLYVDFGSIPYIRSVAPVPFVCQPGQPAELRVSVGDYNQTEVETLRIQAKAGNNSYWFEYQGDGQFRGDLTDLCQALVTTIGCSATQSQITNLQMDTTLVGGEQLPIVSREVETNVSGLICTPTPLPSPTPLPTPTAPPPPDSDLDGIADLNDQCPQQYGLAQFQGCIPWSLIGYTGVGVGLFAILGLVVWPLVKVKGLSPAPQAFVLACREGVAVGKPVSIQQISRSRLASRVVIGGKRSRAHIVIPGLRSVEYYVEWQGGMAFLRDPKDREPFAFFTDEPRTVRTSDPKITLRIATNSDQLECG